MTKFNNKLRKFIKYIIAGLATALAAFYIPILLKTSLRKPTLSDVLGLSITAASTMLILDLCSPKSEG